MKNDFAKISLFILTGIILLGCNTTKRVPDEKKLLYKNEIFVNSKKNKNEDVTDLLIQKPNSKILGYRFRLNLYNLANLKADSLYRAKFINNPEKYRRKSKWLSRKQVKRLGQSFLYAGIHNFLKKTGEAPVLFDSTSTLKSLKKIRTYYINNGFLNTKTSFSSELIGSKKIKIKYSAELGKPFILDTISKNIASPSLDSIFETKKHNTLLIGGKQFSNDDFDEERTRITTDFRNNGAYHFQQNYINYEIDTINKNKKANVKLIIDNQSIVEGDSVFSKPFEIFKINRVNIFTDQGVISNPKSISDSIQFNNFNIYSSNKLKYRPKALTDAIFITKGSVFGENKTSLTAKYISNLKVFNYPLIQYKEDPEKNNELIANIYLIPRPKYHFSTSLDLTHSNIQSVGISGNTAVTIRNVFNGAETFEIALRGSVGSNKELANPNNNFFNISEIGLDTRLNFPIFLIPFNTEKIIPKTMIPFTTMSGGFAKQTNIGLDKQNFSAALTYNWTPKRNVNAKYDLFNIQYVKNVNVSNYFNVYNSSYNSLNNIAQFYDVNPSYLDANNNLLIDFGTNNFIKDVLGSNPTIFPSAQDLNSIRSIDERKKRLTENNLIMSSSYSFFRTTKKDLQDNNFFTFKTKIESSGLFLSLLHKAASNTKNIDGDNTILDVAYSQYAKTEFEFIKHWDLSGKKVFAIRQFTGIAIPYGNSDNIPFSRSYFAGGSNDNRAWQSYSLGPGKTGGINDFNEANLKIAFNAELRFNIFKQLNGALFTDAGNIWNVLDNETDKDAVFSNIKSLENTAIGTGFGLRYDLSFFVVRFDVGFKTYNPARPENQKWFKEYNFSKSVLNIGLNYPF